ncbi:substance-K receptor-like [Macrobrachium nipponense]|uniref:substance-K receptor-like n=1 Tax=Macrobrachium nipponense TaxID=159736 RepID=UPI0030C7F288
MSASLSTTIMKYPSLLLPVGANCNDSCCSFGEGQVICYSDYNFTDRANLTYPEPWELGVRWTYAVLVTVVALLGNLSVILVLSRNRLLLRASVNLFILNVSCADLILALAGPVLFTIRDTNMFYVLGGTWCHLDGFIQIMVMLVSVTSLAVISFDRMMGILRPFHVHLKQWQSLAIIFVIWVYAFVIATPFGFHRVYTTHIWNDLTETMCGEDLTKLQVWWIVVVAALTWIPQGVMIVSYAAIIFSFKRPYRKANRTEHPAIVHLKRRVIRMMFIVVLGLTLSWLPLQALKVFSHLFIDDSGRYIENRKEAYEVLFSVSHYMIYTNCAFNPIVYALMHQTYRRAFRITFSCFFSRKSAFVLRPGVGHRSYVWSLKSENCSCQSNIAQQPRSSRVTRLIKPKKQLTLSAVVSSSTTVAAIALDPAKLKTYPSSERTQRNSCCDETEDNMK